MALRLHGKAGSPLKNIARPIRAFRVEWRAEDWLAIKAAPSVAPAAGSRKQSLPRLSIVVLSFANIGGDPQPEYFVDGITESLTTDLNQKRGCRTVQKESRCFDPPQHDPSGPSGHLPV